MSPCHRCPEQGEAVDAGGGVRRGPGDICGHQVLLNVQQCSPHRGRRTQGQGGCWGRLRPEGHTAPRVCTLQRADCSCTARTAAALEREVWQERLKVLQAERTMWVPHGSHPEQLHGLGLGQQRGPGGQGPQAVPHLFTRGCSHLTNQGSCVSTNQCFKGTDTRDMVPSLYNARADPVHPWDTGRPRQWAGLITAQGRRDGDPHPRELRVQMKTWECPHLYKSNVLSVPPGQFY